MRQLQERCGRVRPEAFYRSRATECQKAYPAAGTKIVWRTKTILLISRIQTLPCPTGGMEEIRIVGNEFTPLSGQTYIF